MNAIRSTLILTSSFVFAMSCTTACAQDSPARSELKRADLSGAPGMEVISSIVEFKPGEEIPKHFHHGVETAYVLQGAMLQAPGKEAALLATGTAITNLRDVVHGGVKVVGDKSFKLFTVHIVDKNKPLYDTQK
ncbi:MAG: cupin domain-containing protein [Pseudomonadota bacterium]